MCPADTAASSSSTRSSPCQLRAARPFSMARARCSERPKNEATSMPSEWYELPNER